MKDKTLKEIKQEIYEELDGKLEEIRIKKLELEEIRVREWELRNKEALEKLGGGTEGASTEIIKRKYLGNNVFKELVVCLKCGHTWETKSNLESIRCPNKECNARVKNIPKLKKGDVQK